VRAGLPQVRDRRWRDYQAAEKLGSKKWRNRATVQWDEVLANAQNLLDSAFRSVVSVVLPTITGFAMLDEHFRPHGKSNFYGRSFAIRAN
jgi:hypothetical protein